MLGGGWNIQRVTRGNHSKEKKGYIYMCYIVVTFKKGNRVCRVSVSCYVSHASFKKYLYFQLFGCVKLVSIIWLNGGYG